MYACVRIECVCGMHHQCKLHYFGSLIYSYHFNRSTKRVVDVNHFITLQNLHMHLDKGAFFKLLHPIESSQKGYPIKLLHITFKMYLRNFVYKKISFTT